MILVNLESVLPEKYFSALLLRVGSITTPVTKVTSYDFTLNHVGDFLVVWPSKATGDWIRILNEPFNMGSNWKSGQSRLYKKMIVYNSEARLLIYADCINFVSKPEIPPL